MTVGRPTKMTPETVSKLEQAFLMGCTDEEACLFADISRQTLNVYQNKNPEFIDRKAVLKSNPVMLARKVQIDALIDNDRNIATRVLDRKEGTRSTVKIESETPEDVRGEIAELERQIAAIAGSEEAGTTEG